MCSAGGFRLEDPDLSPLVLSADRGADSVMGMPVQLTMDLMRGVLEQVEAQRGGMEGLKK